MILKEEFVFDVSNMEKLQEITIALDIFVKKNAIPKIDEKIIK